VQDAAVGVALAAGDVGAAVVGAFKPDDEVADSIGSGSDREKDLDVVHRAVCPG